MTDVRDRDPKIRELVLHIVDAAPDPAPFPVGATPARPPRRRGRVLVAAACAVVLAAVAVVLATKSPSSKEPRVSTSETTVPDPLAGKVVPKQGLAVIDGNRMTLRADDGTVIATVVVAKPSDDVTNDPWNVQLFVTRSGVRLVHLPLRSRPGVPSDCRVPTATAAAADVALCGPRHGDQLLANRVVINNGGWRNLVVTPPGALVGHWEWAARSPDGNSVIAQWSAECETQHAIVTSVVGADMHMVTGEPGRGFAGAPESAVLGWTPSSQILAAFGGSTDCGRGSTVPRGVYLVSRSDLSRRLLVPLGATTSVLRWTSVDDRRPYGSTSSPSSVRAAGDVVPVAVPSGCPNVQITPPQTADDPLVLAADAAIARYVEQTGAIRSDVVVDARYRVRANTGTYGAVFELAVPKYCGSDVADQSYAIELHDRKADHPHVQGFVVAHFAVGWRVWGYAR